MPYLLNLTSYRGWPLRVLSRLPGVLILATYLVSLCGPASAQAPAPEDYLRDLDGRFYLERTDDPIDERVRNHLVPLGAIQKVRGKWSPRESERVTGERVAYTWQVQEGFTAEEVVGELEENLEGDEAVSVLFACEGISCGSSVQWANRIFGERMLYGTQDSQVYRAFGLVRGSQTYRILIYASARTVDRQYVRMEVFTLEDVAP